MIRRAICVACVAAIVGGGPVVAQDRGETVSVRIEPDLAHPATRFEGWGSALAWFANVTGGWPDAEREQLADLFYGPKGLGWTIARYNIGGGAKAGAKPLSQPGANVPGFWRQPAGAKGKDWWRPDDPAMWDWSADANQRWWLTAIQRRVDAPVFEAFSNSPPWFMTVSGEVSGAASANDDNLRPGFEDSFADYLTRVTAELEKRHHIRFATLSPVNEPGTDYWYAGNRQEGSHWSPTRQAKMIDATAASIRRQGLSAVVSAPDETSSELFLTDWAAYPASTRAQIGQINVHSYGNVHQSAVRDIARASNIRLWMSENDHPMPGDPENVEGMTSPLAFAEHIVLDLKRLEPAAWILWQAVESFSPADSRGSNWGLTKADLRAAPDAPHRITITRKYWAMAQFSRYIRPGYRLIPVGDIDTVAALSPDGEKLVLVHVNGGPVARNPVLPKGWRAQMVVTDATHEAACVPGTQIPARSVTTIVLYRGQANNDACAGHR